MHVSDLSRVFAAAIVAGCAARQPAAQQEAAPACRCAPGQACWPAQAEWQRFGASLHGKLEQPQSPLAACRADAAGQACAEALKNSKNPFFLQDQPGGTESAGWLGAWNAAASAWAVVARDSSDIAAAVDFARRNRLRLVVKGTGHDYLGRSNAPDSLGLRHVLLLPPRRLPQVRPDAGVRARRAPRLASGHPGRPATPLARRPAQVRR